MNARAEAAGAWGIATRHGYLNPRRPRSPRGRGARMTPSHGVRPMPGAPSFRRSGPETCCGRISWGATQSSPNGAPIAGSPLTAGWGRRRRSWCRRGSPCTGSPNRSSPRPGTRPTARSDSATRAVGSGRRSSAPTTRCACRAASLVAQDAAGERSTPITTLAAAADHIGRDLLPDDVELDHDQLDVDPSAAAFLGDWYGFAASVLEELRTGAVDGLERARVQLWPEHFDLAVELGSEALGARAAYGCSPGDEDHPEPYLYVAPWVAPAPTSSGRRPGSVARNWAMPSCWPPRISARPP